MAGFRKAKAEQAALKMMLYGPPGSGKTFTALLIAEGLAKRAGKRIAFVDTERGTDFYCKNVSERRIHPEAFDFDACYTRSVSEVSQSVKRLSATDYGVVVIDSLTHLWEAAQAAYTGKKGPGGQIPFHAWGSIKRPYKEIEAYMLSSPMHFIECSRQGNVYQEDEDSGEIKHTGYKAKAEGESPYEPHLLIRMEAVRLKRSGEPVPTAFVEKDRTGILAGKTIPMPTFETLCEPLLYLLGDKQAEVGNQDATAAQDAEAIAAAERERDERSAKLLDQFSAMMALANSQDKLKDIGKKITPDTKAQMRPADVATLKERYSDRDRALSGQRQLVPAE